MTTAHDVIIDCDPGIDDALALFLAAASPTALRLLAVTCVAGNRPVDITTANACRLLGCAGRADVPVYAGAARPLSGASPRCNLVHGADGLGGVALPQCRQPLPGSAADHLVRTLRDAPAQSISVVAIGPLTNLALAEQQHPGVLRRARRVLVMGGAVRHAGNVTPRAEFNFYADPQAAQTVLDAGAELLLFSLDVTTQAVMSMPWIDALADIDGACARAARSMLAAYAALDPLLHDACPVAWLLQPSLFDGERWQLQVDCSDGDDAGHVSGRHCSSGGNAHMLTAVDCDALLALVRGALQRLP